MRAKMESLRSNPDEQNVIGSSKRGEVEWARKKPVEIMAWSRNISRSAKCRINLAMECVSDSQNTHQHTHTECERKTCFIGKRNLIRFSPVRCMHDFSLLSFPLHSSINGTACRPIFSISLSFSLSQPLAWKWENFLFVGVFLANRFESEWPRNLAKPIDSKPNGKWWQEKTTSRLLHTLFWAIILFGLFVGFVFSYGHAAHMPTTFQSIAFCVCMHFAVKCVEFIISTFLLSIHNDAFLDGCGWLWLRSLYSFFGSRGELWMLSHICSRWSLSPCYTNCLVQLKLRCKRKQPRFHECFRPHENEYT